MVNTVPFLGQKADIVSPPAAAGTIRLKNISQA